MDSPARLKAHLPRLPPEYYRGRAFVHWTLTLEDRATGWRTPSFHHTWKLMLLHACARYSFACPAYVLMPDHVHLLWLGLDEKSSDQHVAIEFLRQHLRPFLAPADWQRQAHDNVLRESERERGAFQLTAQYIFDNPVRGRLTARWQDYPFPGGCIAGYPDLDVRREDYWELFWRPHQGVRPRIFEFQTRTTRSFSPRSVRARRQKFKNSRPDPSGSWTPRAPARS